MSNSDRHDRLSAHFMNLASARAGARTVFVTDDFFAPCQRMLDPAPAVFVPGKFDANGKWMDGWESRRKRDAGYDYCVVRLAQPGVIRGVDIDTRHFIGNHPPSASLEACLCPDGDPGADTRWHSLLGVVPLGPDSPHLHDVQDPQTYSHVRLNIFPDGGIARLRVYGQPRCDWDGHDDSLIVDLVALENGGHAVACSDQGFGSSMHSLVLPGRGKDMGDGWETARRRVPGNEWVILALGHRGVVNAVEIDTAFYKGNFPDRVSVQGGVFDTGDTAALITASMFWPPLLDEQKLAMDAIAVFDDTVQAVGPITHARINIFPDGGLSRVRLHGRVDRDALVL